MQNKEILNKCAEIDKLIDSQNLSDSFKALSEIASDRKDFQLREELGRLKDTYRYMTGYLLDGNPDPSRETVYSDITEGLRTAVDKIKRDVIGSDSSDVYSETLRYQKLRKDNISELLDRFSSLYSEKSLAESAGDSTVEINRLLENIQSELFNIAWVSFADKKVADEISKAVISGKYGDSLSHHLVSALTLSLCGYFDRYKLLALLDIYEAEISKRLSARALTGLLLALSIHSKRIAGQRSLMVRLSTLEDSLISFTRIREFVMAMIRTRDTDRVAAKMKEEVLPELMKLRPDILKKMREGGVESIDAISPEENPEWDELLNKTGLNEKMQELSEMQSDGADLMMVAFSNLKQFPFFNNVSNWFLPFNPSHTMIDVGEKEREMIGKIMEIGRGICDSDKYSLAIAMGKMPESQKQMMSAQMDAQFAQFTEEAKDRELKTANPVFAEEVTKTIRDLYRFFKLFRKKEGFRDPFASSFDFLSMPVAGDMMSDPEIIPLIAEFYFKRGYYADALNFFSFLSEEYFEDASIWEKLGVCYQELKFYDKALEAYNRAELLRKPGTWLLKKLAYINKRLGNYAEALGYYKLLLEKYPEENSLLLNAGFCALEAGDIAEALSYYYHADYVKSENLAARRAIAWCEFLKGDHEKSEKYHDRILSTENPLPSDYLNAGHLQAVKGNYRKALSLYKNAAKENTEDFKQAFIHDLPTLRKAGLPGQEAYILMDAVREEL